MKWRVIYEFANGAQNDIEPTDNIDSAVEMVRSLCSQHAAGVIELAWVQIEPVS